MTASEFRGINARQRWANWRTIPKNLKGRLPDRPCRALDLCSGIGDSSEVLAYYLPSGSQVLGLEYNPEFVRVARQRTYRDAAGAPVRASFSIQSVLDSFHGETGERVADKSIDVVNSCGAIGINFSAQDIDILAGEICRVLRFGGLAAIDSPADPSGVERMRHAFRKHAFEVLGSARSCFLDRFIQICFRRRFLPAR